jgi:hypothetical protein
MVRDSPEENYWWVSARQSRLPHTSRDECIQSVSRYSCNTNGIFVPNPFVDSLTEFSRSAGIRTKATVDWATLTVVHISQRGPLTPTRRSMLRVLGNWQRIFVLPDSCRSGYDNSIHLPHDSITTFPRPASTQRPKYNHLLASKTGGITQNINAQKDRTRRNFPVTRTRTRRLFMSTPSHFEKCVALALKRQDVEVQ